jgi:hypothetical protein
MEAYILVHRIGFSYTDVKGMLKSERTSFIKLFSDEVKQENDAIKRNKSR